jgi:hypothetical protein
VQTDKTKNLEKIQSAFSKLDKNTKRVLKAGTILALVVLAAGTLLLLLNHTAFNYDPYIEYVSNSVIKASFTILAEVIIGSLLLDFVFCNKG